MSAILPPELQAGRSFTTAGDEVRRCDTYKVALIELVPVAHSALRLLSPASILGGKEDGYVEKCPDVVPYVHEDPVSYIGHCGPILALL